MTLEQLKTMSNELVQAIRDYTQEKDFDSVELEIVIDDLLCKMPRDMVYIEWFDRSQIKDVADSQLNNEDASEDLVDACIYDLWSSNDSLMTGDDLYERIADTIREQH